jgi:hypothetical protein
MVDREICQEVCPDLWKRCLSMNMTCDLNNRVECCLECAYKGQTDSKCTPAESSPAIWKDRYFKFIILSKAQERNNAC